MVPIRIFFARVMWFVATACLSTSFALAQGSPDLDELMVAARMAYEASFEVSGAEVQARRLEARRFIDAAAATYPGEFLALQTGDDGMLQGIDLGLLPDSPDWYGLVVLGGRIGGGGFRHGTYPSLGESIHPGVDISQNCGKPVMAPVPGVIVRVVSNKISDEDLAAAGSTRDELTRDLDVSTGFAVVLKHADNSAGQPVYTLYLHLAGPPANAEGKLWRRGQRVEAGDQLGLTGNSGKVITQRCVTHFEVRHFAGIRGLYHQKIGNIYIILEKLGADKDAEKALEAAQALLARDWSDPKTWLRRQFVQAISSRGVEDPYGNPTQIGDQGWIVQKTPSATLTEPVRRGALEFRQDTSVAIRESVVMKPGMDPFATRLDIYMSPIVRTGVVIQSDADWGGLRAIVVDFEAGDVVLRDLIPETRVRGNPDADWPLQPIGEISWSPDGRYVALPVSERRDQRELMVADLKAGTSAITASGETGTEDRWRYALMDALSSAGNGMVNIAYDIRECASEACESFVSMGRIEETLRLDSFMEEPRDPQPVSEETSGAHEEDRAGEGGQIDRWGPEVVAHFKVPPVPCQNRERSPHCMRELGFSEQAIAYAKEVGDDYSGSVFVEEFRELGPVDYAAGISRGAHDMSIPTLLNGKIDIETIGSTGLPREVFRDHASRVMLSRYRDATIWRHYISAHRILPDGTQRFVLTEWLTDGCHACEFLGEGITFVDVGPATGDRIRRTPVGLYLVPGDFKQWNRPVLVDDAKALQYHLNARGYNAGMMDGYPGPQTRTALMEFQAEQCLAPTGQPNPRTVQTLLDSDEWQAPCARQPGIEDLDANEPLEIGMYVDDRSYCSQTTVPFSLRVVRDGWINFGTEVVCTTRRTDIRNGMTLFRGSCSGGDQTWQSDWTFNVESPTQFVEMPRTGGVDRPTRFWKCPDSSTLRQEWSAWFE